MHILIITHAQDRLIGTDGTEMRSGYMLGPSLHRLARMGHHVNVCRGIPKRAPAADLALMHVDLTVVPDDYAAFGALYPRCLNLGARDVSKRKVSQALIAPGDAWDGPVIVKTDLNFGGFQEARLAGAAEPGHGPGYRIYGSPAEVPDAVAADPSLVIERFLPERHRDGYAVRFWTFSGAEERCARVLSPEPIVKAANATGFDFCEVPDELRALRRQLGFDYGKFDFVIHDGRAVLIDANKTPGAPPLTDGATWPQDFARGLLGGVDSWDSHEG